jgi:hypothetical protein
MLELDALSPSKQEEEKRNARGAVPESISQTTGGLVPPALTFSLCSPSETHIKRVFIPYEPGQLLPVPLFLTRFQDHIEVPQKTT